MAMVRVRKRLRASIKAAKLAAAHELLIKNIPKHEIIEKISTLSTAAFGLVAALAWNDMIKGVFDQYFTEKNGLWAQFAYALFVTMLAVLVAFYIGRAAAKLKNEDAKKQLEIQIAEAEQAAKQAPK